MATLGGQLSSLKVTRAREPGMFADGDGLYLQVTRANARSWIFRYFRNGKSREMGLGYLKAVGLAAARLKAGECRALLADGIDPIAARTNERAQRAVEDARAITFDHCAAVDWTILSEQLNAGRIGRPTSHLRSISRRVASVGGLSICGPAIR